MSSRNNDGKAVDVGGEHHSNNDSLSSNSNNNNNINSDDHHNNITGLDPLAAPFGYLENLNPEVIESIKQSIIMDSAQAHTHNNTCDISTNCSALPIPIPTNVNVNVNAHQLLINQAQVPWINDAAVSMPAIDVTNNVNGSSGVIVNGNVNDGGVPMPLTHSNLLHQQQQSMQLQQHQHQQQQQHNTTGLGLPNTDPIQMNAFGQQLQQLQQVQTQQQPYHPHVHTHNQTQQSNQHALLVANMNTNMNMNMTMNGIFSSPQPVFTNLAPATVQHQNLQHQHQQTQIQNQPALNQTPSQNPHQDFSNVQPHQQYLPQQLLTMPMHNIYIGQQAVHSIHQQQSKSQSQSSLSAQTLQHQSNSNSNKRKARESNITVLQQAATEEETSNTAISASSCSGTSRGGMLATSASVGLASMPLPVSVTDSMNFINHNSNNVNDHDNLNINNPINNNNHCSELAQVQPPRSKRGKGASHSPSAKPVTDMTPIEQRRHGRNSREQQRSQKISLQINDLRQVLSEAKVPFKRNKFSILMSVVNYIKHLQERASFLDHEHQKLINTMRQTSEMTHSGVIHKIHVDDDDLSNDNGNNIIGNDAELLYVKGLDYKSIFEQCSFPLGVAALDGRFLTWNLKFEALTGMKKENLGSATLFGLLAAHDTDEVFRALGTLLKDCDSDNTAMGRAELNDNNGIELPSSSGDDTLSNGNGNCGENSGGSSGDDNAISSGDDSGLTTISNGYWVGTLSKPFQNTQMRISVSRTANGVQKFFNCTLFTSTMDDSDDESCR